MLAYPVEIHTLHAMSPTLAMMTSASAPLAAQLMLLTAVAGASSIAAANWMQAAQISHTPLQ
jgi:hypothetical protein